MAGSSFSITKQFWDALSKIKMPPKANHFMWGVVNNALVTKDSLFKRKCASKPACDICKVQVEIVEHMLFLCPWVKGCWFGSPLALKFDDVGMFRADKWLEEWLLNNKHVKDYDVTLFTSICWEIWKCRCKFVFENEEVDAIRCLTNAIRLANEFWSIIVEDSRNKDVKHGYNKVDSWFPPEADAVKINVDAAFCHVSGNASVGVVGRDCVGNFLGGWSGLVQANSPFMAECWSLLKALEINAEFGDADLIFETDCLELYQRMMERNIMGCDWGCVDLLKKSWLLWDSSSNFSLSLVSNKGNNAANALAAFFMRGVIPKGWLT